MDAGFQLKMLRMQKGLTLEQVANYVGVSKPTVLKWENGKISNMKRDKIAKYSECLGVSPMDIINLYESSKDNETMNISVEKNDGIISNGNKNRITYKNNLGEIEKEVLNLLKELNTKQKTKLLMKLYDIVEEIKNEQ